MEAVMTVVAAAFARARALGPLQSNGLKISLFVLIIGSAKYQ